VSAAASVLGVVPARGGSKALPRKNVLPVGGRPLIAWTLRAAQSSRLLTRTVVSTDDDEIADAALAHGGEVPFRRPAELAQDDSSAVAVVLHALEQVGRHDYVVLLQPTSPLRSSADIDAAVQVCLTTGAPSCVSVTRAEQNPYWMYTLNDNVLSPILPDAPAAHRRQDLPEVYRLNGAVYVAATDWLRDRGSFVGPGTIGHVMPPERSLDIDTDRDLRLLHAQLGG
jgi:CMP-N,N'-diacetyllegionaminic acid synthase